MPFKPYDVKPINEIERLIPQLVQYGKAGRVVNPLLYVTLDMRVLLVGNTDRGRFKLPSAIDAICNPDRPLSVRGRVQSCSDFVLAQAGRVPDFDYLGLFRHKIDQKTVIAPIVVKLPIDSGSSRLEASADWNVHAPLDRDRTWADASELQAILEDPAEVVSGNTATIIRFAQSVGI